MDSPYDFKVKDIDGKEVDLGKYKGKVVLVVNVASQCGKAACTMAPFKGSSYLKWLCWLQLGCGREEVKA